MLFLAGGLSIGVEGCCLHTPLHSVSRRYVGEGVLAKVPKQNAWHS